MITVRRADAAVIGGAAAGVLLTAWPIRHGRIPGAEEAVFRWINDLPDIPHVLAWVPLQVGNAWAPMVLAAVLVARRRRALASQALIGGVFAWVAAKGVKVLVTRGRPAALLDDVTTRADAVVGGRGWVSGHGAVAAALVTILWPHLGRRGHVLAVAAIAPMYVLRVYSGGHFPLDMVGGALFGVVVGRLSVVLVARGRRARVEGPFGPVRPLAAEHTIVARR